LASAAYALVLAVLLLPAATLGDRLGRRRLFLAGLVIFTAGSLACALAPTALALQLFRALQGVGGAVLFATATPLLRAEFSGAALARALGVFGATLGGATAIGPLAGGVLTDTLGWRFIFFVNLPIGVAASTPPASPPPPCTPWPPSPAPANRPPSRPPPSTRPSDRPGPKQRHHDMRAALQVQHLDHSASGLDPRGVGDCQRERSRSPATSSGSPAAPGSRRPATRFDPPSAPHAAIEPAPCRRPRHQDRPPGPLPDWSALILQHGAERAAADFQEYRIVFRVGQEHDRKV